MNKFSEMDTGEKLKTGINTYRVFTFFIFCMFLAITIFYAIFNVPTYAIICFLLCSLFLMITIFMDKLVYFMRLPTNLLIVYQDKIVYQKRKQKFTFFVRDITYRFHSFFEDLEALPYLIIISNDKEYCILITKKQYKLFTNILEK